MNLFVNENLIPINSQPFEIVERKGLGHPDTIADGIAESISIDYSNYCLEKFGAILHHNVDKISIIGGLCEIDFGFGKMKNPIRLILNGRMSERFGDTNINIKELQSTSAKNYLHRVLPNLDIEKWLDVHSFVSSSSSIPFWFAPRSLDDLPDFRNPHANDTSTVVGFWPLSITEKIVLDAEKFFYKPDLKSKFDFVGQDIKIMGIRKKRKLDLIICVPFFAEKILSYANYEEKLDFIKRELFDYLQSKFGDSLYLKLYINTKDQWVKDKNIAKGRYFVVTGSALDYGEEGIAGRGNRYRGVISSIRPYSVESIYGKNPVYHVGKIYAHIANILAKKIGSELNCEVNVIITTRNGDPLYEPYSIIVNISEREDEDNIIKEMIINELKIRDWTKEIVANKVFLPTTDLNYEE